MAQLGSTTISGNLGVSGSVSAQRFNATCDKRLKTNITEYVPTKSILDLTTYEFDYIDSNEHTIGCLAQDLLEICPEIVNQDENGYLSIQESKLVYLLLQEVTKLKQELNELKRR